RCSPTPPSGPICAAPATSPAAALCPSDRRISGSSVARIGHARKSALLSSLPASPDLLGQTDRETGGELLVVVGVVVRLVVAVGGAGAADHDLVGLDPHGDLAV